MADLLEKFGNVKVDVTSKVAESDNIACLLMQGAYDKACEALKQLRSMEEIHIAAQKSAIENLPSGSISDYLGGCLQHQQNQLSSARHSRHFHRRYCALV